MAGRAHSLLFESFSFAAMEGWAVNLSQKSRAWLFQQLATWARRTSAVQSP